MTENENVKISNYNIIKTIVWKKNTVNRIDHTNENPTYTGKTCYEILSKQIFNIQNY